MFILKKLKNCRSVHEDEKDSATRFMTQWTEQSVKKSEIIESDLVSRLSLFTFDTSFGGGSVAYFEPLTHGPARHCG
jgi:hypothetical protein